jgi:DUF4097 and DUF4098 domain-containing protein YvlB
MPTDADKAPGFRRIELSPEGAERLVMRFAEADISLSPSDGEGLLAEMELRGPNEAVASWMPSVRRIEGILVLGEEDGPVHVKELRLKMPASIRDIEAHSGTGDVEASGLPVCFLIGVDGGSVSVKGATSLDATSVSGEIETFETGTSDLRSESGKIRCVGSAGKLIAKNDSGDIEVDDATADLYLETGSGEILVSRPKGRVRVLSNSGDIEIESPASFGGGEANSSSGHITLTLEGAAVELRAETLSGRLKTPEGEVLNTTGPRRFAASVLGGGRRLHVKSVSGNIEIEY